MFRFKLGILAFLALFAVTLCGPVYAADATVTPSVRHSKGIVAPRARASALATIVPPRVAYGCKRIWRCDAQVCEWRRGCWGVYGYMEGPYYSVALAKRQWERDGWPAR